MASAVGAAAAAAAAGIMSVQRSAPNYAALFGGATLCREGLGAVGRMLVVAHGAGQLGVDA
eukprot:1157438-Pelagomonas_calceolata.AAC.2